MDYGTFGSIFTVLVLVVFVAIVYWTFSKKNKSSFEEAANLVFDDEQEQQTKQTKRESSVNE